MWQGPNSLAPLFMGLYDSSLGSRGYDEGCELILKIPHTKIVQGGNTWVPGGPPSK